MIFLVACEIGAIPLRFYAEESHHDVRASFTSTPPPGVDLKIRYVEPGATRTHRVERGGTGAPLDVTVRLEVFSLAGPFWVPFRKSGTASWSASVEGAMTGTLEGTLELTLNGVVSARWFVGVAKHAVREKIRETIRARLR